MQNISTQDIIVQKPTAVLVAINTAHQGLDKTNEYLRELEFLAEALGILTIKVFIQNLDTPHARTYVGKGKLEEIKLFVKSENIKYVIFDDELAPSQVRNLEYDLDCDILDRTLLIFKIFAMRARTAQAKTQVELAQYQYLLPRLTRMWTHLSRQQGGGANMRGPGEKELETDKRIAKTRISILKEDLKKIEQQSITQRKKRSDTVKVALVGYTNVGKSTLMNVLSKANVFADNKLFATLDSTIRKTVVRDIPFLLSDTVGFIRKLPHSLVECFKSTLDQVAEADLLLHVVDVAHPSYLDHISVVERTLQEIDADKINTIIVFNKKDEVDDFDGLLHKLNSIYANRNYVYISAKKKENIDLLKSKIYDIVAEIHKKIYPNYLKCANSISNSGTKAS